MNHEYIQLHTDARLEKQTPRATYKECFHREPLVYITCKREVLEKRNGSHCTSSSIKFSHYYICVRAHRKPAAPLVAVRRDAGVGQDTSHHHSWEQGRENPREPRQPQPSPGTSLGCDSPRLGQDVRTQVLSSSEQQPKQSPGYQARTKQGPAVPSGP